MAQTQDILGDEELDDDVDTVDDDPGEVSDNSSFCDCPAHIHDRETPLVIDKGLSQAFNTQSSTPNISYTGPDNRANQTSDIFSVDQSTLHDQSTTDQSTVDKSDLDQSVLDQSEKLSVPEQLTSKSEATKSSSTSETAVSVDTTILIQDVPSYYHITHEPPSPSLIYFPPNYSYGCLEKKWSL